MDDILNEQIEYYRARAQEYDATTVGPDGLNLSEVEGTIAGELGAAAKLLRDLGPFDQVLELACGTGIWTQVLLSIGREILAVDAAPEMLEIARRKVGDAPVRFQQADLFHWQTEQEYELVFFASWLSHVPPEALDGFLEKVCRAVRKGGQLVIVDQYAPTGDDRRVAREEKYALRPMDSGQTFTIVKVFYDERTLEAKLRRLGFEAEFRKLGDFVFLLSGTRYD